MCRSGQWVPGRLAAQATLHQNKASNPLVPRVSQGWPLQIDKADQLEFHMVYDHLCRLALPDLDLTFDPRIKELILQGEQALIVEFIKQLY